MACRNTDSVRIFMDKLILGPARSVRECHKVSSTSVNTRSNLAADSVRSFWSNWSTHEQYKPQFPDKQVRACKNFIISPFIYPFFLFLPSSRLTYICFTYQRLADKWSNTNANGSADKTKWAAWGIHFGRLFQLW